MDNLEQTQPSSIKIETRHYNIASTIDSLRTQEKRLTSLGPRDEVTTKIFQDYHLPGQEFVRERPSGEKVKFVRALLDPEEYVIRVDREEGFARFLEIVQEDQLSLAKGWKKHKIPGEPPLWTSLEIITGEKDRPDDCYRFKLLDAQMS